MRHPVERRAPRPSRRVHAYRAVENLYAENLSESMPTEPWKTCMRKT
ncbi:hypothetical protein SBA7_1960002 [Candidatus Sulfotelmatobacter sp. SbA7]|nr:hypothetical protein SBA7_1960002 [Candidatus Sulfotelmatobacter sp. SbA7]